MVWRCVCAYYGSDGLGFVSGRRVQIQAQPIEWISWTVPKTLPSGWYNLLPSVQTVVSHPFRPTSWGKKKPRCSRSLTCIGRG